MAVFLSYKMQCLALLYGCAGYGEFICLLRDPDVLPGLKATVGQPLTHEPDLWKLNGIAATIKAGMSEDDLLIDLEGAHGYASVFVPGILHSGIFLFKAAQRHLCMPHGKPVLYL